MVFDKISVRYKTADGWHIFSSLNLPGLYVANKDMRYAFEDIGNAIEKLISLNNRVICEAIYEFNFAEFLDQLFIGNANNNFSIRV